MVNDLDAHERPPDVLRQVYKKYSKRDKAFFKDNVQVIDFAAGSHSRRYDDFEVAKYEIDDQQLEHVFRNFLRQEAQNDCTSLEEVLPFSGVVYQCKSIDGMKARPLHNIKNDGVVKLTMATRFYGATLTIAIICTEDSPLTYLPS